MAAEEVVVLLMVEEVVVNLVTGSMYSPLAKLGWTLVKANLAPSAKRSAMSGQTRHSVQLGVDE